MNNQNPLSSQDSLLEQKNTGRTRTKLVVFSVIALHCAVLLGFLMVGCKKEQEAEPAPATDLAATDTATNAEPYFEPYTNAADTNLSTAAPLDATNMPGAMPSADSNYSAAPAPAPALPAPTALTATPTPGGTTEYVIGKGDSFSSIAKKFGVSVRAITEANPNVAPTKLQIGQKIQVPAASAAASSAAELAPATGAAAPSTVSAAKTYTVKSGDTLSRIATQHKVSIKALRSANNLKTDRIKVGQKLKIPAKASATPAPVAAPVAAPTLAPEPSSLPAPAPTTAGPTQ